MLYSVAVVCKSLLCAGRKLYCWLTDYQRTYIILYIIIYHRRRAGKADIYNNIILYFPRVIYYYYMRTRKVRIRGV